MGLILVSCGSSGEGGAAVKTLIGKYNSALAQAYKDGNFDPLIKVADGAALKKADTAYQAYLNAQGIILDSELLELKFENVSLGSGDNESKIKVEWDEKEKEWREIYVYKETFVETEERWKYKWVDKKTGEPASPVVTVKYRMSYTIDRAGDSLKVISSEIKKEDVESMEGSADRWKVNAQWGGAH